MGGGELYLRLETRKSNLLPLTAALGFPAPSPHRALSPPLLMALGVE